VRYTRQTELQGKSCRSSSCNSSYTCNFSLLFSHRGIVSPSPLISVRPLSVHQFQRSTTYLFDDLQADANPGVRDKMADAGVAIINEHGKDNVALLLPIFENYLDRKSADEERYDLVREGVVIFMGALAKHLSPDSPKISDIVERMLEVLNTPSEAVQRAVSNCLAPLMRSQQVRLGLSLQWFECLTRKCGQQVLAALFVVSSLACIALFLSAPGYDAQSRWDLPGHLDWPVQTIIPSVDSSQTKVFGVLECAS
jgi:hypothetical protein